MQSVSEAILKRSSDKFGWISPLKQFAIENASSLTFVDKYGLETKKEFISNILTLLQSIDNEWDFNSPERSKIEEGLKYIFDSIRLCCRETEGIEKIENEKYLSIFLKMSNLDGTFPISSNVSSEVVKSMVNILVKLPNSAQILTNLSAHEKILSKLKSIIGNYDPNSEVFPLFRILFLLSMKPIASTYLCEQNAVALLIKFLKFHVNNPSIVTTDILRGIFNLTAHLGPLNNSFVPQSLTPNEKENFVNIIPYLKTILNLPETFLQYKLDTLNCMINIPTELYKSILDSSVVSNLAQILEIQIKDKEKPADALTSILIILTLTARFFPEYRNVLRKRVLPNDVLNSNGDLSITIEGSLKENSIAGILSQHMMSSNFALKHYSQDFLYALCNDDSQEFIKLVGFGPGAAKLAEQGGLLESLKAISQTKPKVVEQKQEKKEKVEEEDSSETSTDEEEEREAQQLFEKMQRLEKLGLISMMDPNNQKK